MIVNLTLLVLIHTLCKVLSQEGCHIKYSYTNIEDGEILFSRTVFPYISFENVQPLQGELLAPCFGLNVACGSNPERRYWTYQITTPGFKVTTISL